MLSLVVWTTEAADHTTAVSSVYVKKMAHTAVFFFLLAAYSRAHLMY